jgi:hypothetical protein
MRRIRRPAVPDEPDDEAPLKSSYELAMERLRARDSEPGERTAPLNEKQKREIARLRQESRAKLAELEILHRKEVASAPEDREKLEQIEERYRIDRGRVESSLESAIARVKRRPAKRSS